VPFDVVALAGLPRMMKDPVLIPSNDSGIGGALVFHMSAIDRRFNMSEWNTWRLPVKNGANHAQHNNEPSRMRALQPPRYHFAT